MFKGILAIKPNGEFSFFKINCNQIGELDIKNFPNEVKTLFGKGGISRECDFKCIDYDISVFAFSDGRAGKENKFELPPPIDQTLYFGCLIVIAHKENTIMTLTQTMFDAFYERVFEGFVNLGGEDTWSSTEEENSDDRDFIVDDDHIEYEEGASEETEEEEYVDEEEIDDLYIESSDDDTPTDTSVETPGESTDENKESSHESTDGEEVISPIKTDVEDSLNVKLKITIVD